MEKDFWYILLNNDYLKCQVYNMFKEDPSTYRDLKCIGHASGKGNEKCFNCPYFEFR